MPYTLAFKDRFLRVEESLIESDTSNSIAFASIPDNTPTKLAVEWTGKQYTKLVSALMTGAQLMFPDEANEIIWQLIKVVHQPVTFEDEDTGGCLSYPISSPFISFLPQNPYNQPDFVPSGYVQPPFHLNSDFVWPDAFGFLASDIMVSLDSLPFFANWGDLLSLNFPTIKIHVRGTGQIELDLIAVELGGYACIKIGSPPNILDLADGIIETGAKLVDLNQDSLSIPPESDMIVEDEINIDAPDGTDVYIVFVPKIDDSISFYGFGGGIRSLQLCGLEGGIEGGVIVEDVRFNTENCTFEKRVLGVWEAIEGGDEWLMCVEALMATQAEIKQAIIDAELELMSRALSGDTGNVKSAIVINTDFSKEYKDIVTPDDPTTVDRDEESESRCGGVIAVEKGINEMLNYAYTLFGTDTATDTPNADFRYLMKTKYDCDESLMDTAASNYFDARVVNAETINSLSASALQNKLFSKGNLKSVAINYVLTLTGNTLAARQKCVDFIAALNQSQLETWYNLGIELPSTLYLDYTSVPSPSEEIQIITAGVTYNGARSWKANHRLEFTVEGFWTDSVDSDIIDFWWYRTAAGVLTSRIANTSIQLGTGITKPTANQVPYSSSHKYVFTIDTPAAAGSVQLNVSASGITTQTTTTNGIKVTIRDLGEVLVQ